MDVELNKLKVVDLKQILKDLGLKTSGRKAELIERIIKSREPEEFEIVEEVVLPKDIIFQIALELALPDLFSYCLASKKYNKIACDSKEFWRARLLREKLLKKDDDITELEDPKKYYKLRRKEFKDFLSKKLLEFSYNGDLKNVIKVIKLGANINHVGSIKDMSFTNSLVIASYRGHFDIVKYLIENGKWNHYALGSALVESLKERHNNIAKYLVENGADPDYDEGWPISIATLNLDHKMARFLESKLKN